MSTGDSAAKHQESLPELPGSQETTTSTSAPVPDRSQALHEVFRNHNAALVRFLAVRTGSTEDAKEIVQEAYAKLLALDRPGTLSFLAAYLWRVAVNLSIDRRRRRTLDERYRQTALPSVEKRDFSAESVAAAREHLTIVQRAIDELPPRCHEALCTPRSGWAEVRRCRP